MRIFFLLLLAASYASSAAETDLACPELKSFYVISHGWHTGIAVESDELMARIPALGSDLGDGAYIEVGWGDEQFYQSKEFTYGLAMRAILLPTTTVLHLVDITEEPRQFFPASKIMKLSVPEAGHEKLINYIAGSFLRNEANDIQARGTGLYGNSRFYTAKGNFHALNTCNTWVSRGIAVTGFPLVNSNTITADDLMSQLVTDSGTDCYKVE